MYTQNEWLNNSLKYSSCVVSSTELCTPAAKTVNMQA